MTESEGEDRPESEVYRGFVSSSCVLAISRILEEKHVGMESLGQEDEPRIKISDIAAIAVGVDDQGRTGTDSGRVGVEQLVRQESLEGGRQERRRRRRRGLA